MSNNRRNTATASDANSKFVAHVYQDDYRQIQELVWQYPNIETGGDLFGLWKDESTVVIQLFIGPGKKCNRTTTSFHQDTEYLHRVGSLVTTEEGLCNVGEWHSHHQIGMPEPSAADRRTVFNNMPQLGLERFVLFIATIETGYRSQGKTKKRQHDVQPEQVMLHSFLFIGPTHNVVSGEIKIIQGANPHRIRNRAIREIENGAELPPTGDPPGRLPKSKSSDEDSVTGSTRAQQTKRSTGTKGPLKTTQEKPSDGKTLLKQAEAPKETTAYTEQNGRPPAVSRETKPYKESGAVPQVQNNRDKESLPTARKPEGDQQHRHRVENQSTSKSCDKRNPNQPQATGGYNKENVSQNFGSGPSRNSYQSQGFPNDPQPTGRISAGGRDARGNMHSTTSYFNEQMMQRSSNARQERVGGGTESVDLRKMSATGFF